MGLLEGYKKGVNLGGWISQCKENYTEEHYDTFITEKDIAYIKELGFDHVRLPIDYNVVQNEDGSFIEEHFKYVDNCLAWCKKYGLKMVLDLHKACGYVFDNSEYCGFFFDEKLQTIFNDLWMEFTRRYGKEDIMAFELLNEVTEARFAEPWNKISANTIKMIHSIVPEKTIIIGGIYNSSIYGVTLLDKPVDDHVVFTFHSYDPMIFTHQGAYWIEKMPSDYSTTYPLATDYIKEQSRIAFGTDFDSHFEGFGSELISAEFFRKLFKPALDVAKKYNVELYCGEYGVIDAADNESLKNWYTDIHTALNEENIPHTAWNYKEMDFDITGEARKPVLNTIIEA